MNDHVLEPADLSGQGFHTVVVATPDLAGRLVGRRVPAEGFGRVLTRGVDVCTCAFSWNIDQDLGLIERDVFPLCGMHNGIPDVTLVPDLATLRPAAWLDGVAICLADPVHRASGDELSIAPRVILKRALERLAGRGLRMLAGTEVEFYLFLNEPRALRKSGFVGLEPTTLVPADFMIHEGNTYESFFRPLRAALVSSGIEVETAQSEWGTGQWEMPLRYTDALEVADRQALYKLAVRDSAAMAGMSATFMAKPLNQGQPGSSCHVHVSLVDEAGVPVFWDDAADHHMGGTMRSAIAGVLDHIVDFMAWYAPTVNSYRRVNSADVAGWGTTWGVDNRTVSVRVVGHDPGELRMEFRLPGADTNPHLTVAALAESMYDGLIQGTALGPPVDGNGYDQPVDPRMPQHLGDAARDFRGSAFVRSLLGDQDVEHLATLLDDEWRTFLAVVSDWDLHRYFDRI